MISLLDVQRNEIRAMRLEEVYHRKKCKEIFHCPLWRMSFLTRA